MRNLDIEDTRQKLGVYTRAGLIGAGSAAAIPNPAEPQKLADRKK
jgi:argininosuccinate synthase